MVSMKMHENYNNPHNDIAILKLDGIALLALSATIELVSSLVANIATRLRHLHKLQIWRPDDAICVSCKYGHQIAPLA